MKERFQRKTKALLGYEARFDELTSEQQADVLAGKYTGHPSNAPKNKSHARRWLYFLNIDKTIKDIAVCAVL